MRRTAVKVKIVPFLRSLAWRFDLKQMAIDFSKSIRLIQIRMRAQSLYSKTRTEKLMKYWEEELNEYQNELAKSDSYSD